MSRATARIGDAITPHCSEGVIAEGSPNVYVNGRAWARLGDLTTVHLKPSGSGCDPHSAPIETGSSVVFINGIAAARIGDTIVDCTAVSQGSPNVYAG